MVHKYKRSSTTNKSKQPINKKKGETLVDTKLSSFVNVLWQIDFLVPVSRLICFAEMLLGLRVETMGTEVVEK